MADEAAKDVVVTPEQWATALALVYGFDRDRDDGREMLGALLSVFGLSPPSAQGR